MQSQTILRAGAVLGALAVAAGAFGAHGLQDRLSAAELANWDTAARYQIYHALALVLCGVLARDGRRTAIPAGCLLLGTVIFAGTLYAMALGGPRWLGAITPIGGTLLIAGWVALGLGRAVAQPPRDARPRGN